MKLFFEDGSTKILTKAVSWKPCGVLNGINFFDKNEDVIFIAFCDFLIGIEL